MKLEHEFTVPATLDEAWAVLLDVEKVAPCMPGAALTSVDGDEFTGTVKVKVGPIQVTYKGQAKFVEKDEAAHRVVIEASGKESRGSGTAAATVTANLSAAGSKTKAHVVTDLNITGRPAQFGRGVMADVGAKLIGQFADCLADELAGGGTAATESTATTESTAATAETTTPPATDEAPAKKAPAKKAAAKKAAPAKTTAAAGSAQTPSANPSASTAPSPPRQPSPPRKPAEPIDLLDVAGGSIAKRVAPVAVVLLLLLLIIRRRRR